MLKSLLMHKNIFLGLLLTLFVHFISACSGIIEPDTGGVFDTPNMIRGAVIDKNGTAVEGAAVSLKSIEITELGTSEIASFETETVAGGIYSFSDIPQGNYVVVAKSNYLSVIDFRVNVGNSDTINLKSLKVQERVTLVGRVVNRVGRIGEVLVAIPGVNIQSTINSDGEYFLDSVPKGDFKLTFIEDGLVNYLPIRIFGDSDTVFIRDVEMVEVGTDNVYSHFRTNLSHFVVTPVIYSEQNIPQWYEGKSFEGVNYFEFNFETSQFQEIDELGRPFVLIDDFEYSDMIPLVDVRRGGFMHGSGWFIFDDRPAGGMSYFIPEEIINNRSLGLVREGAYSGQSFHATMILSDTISFPLLGFGVPFSAYYDMSDLEFVSFFARGSGQISFSMWTQLVLGYPEGENWGHFEQIITLEENWREYRLFASDFLPRPFSVQQADSVTWSDARGFVRGFEFMASSNTQDTVVIWIDNINFTGSRFRQTGEIEPILLR